jgi:hypothetical protein
MTNCPFCKTQIINSTHFKCKCNRFIVAFYVDYIDNILYIGDIYYVIHNFKSEYYKVFHLKDKPSVINSNWSYLADPDKTTKCVGYILNFNLTNVDNFDKEVEEMMEEYNILNLLK